MGVSRQTASKRLHRSRSGKPMSGRSSRPRRLARSTQREVEERVAAARRELMLAPLGLADIDRVTVEVRRRGSAAPVRYERERPGGWSTRTSRRSRGSRTAAAGWPAGSPSSRIRTPAPATPVCTSPWTTAAASLAPSRCPTRRRAPARCSWAARRVSARGWA